MRNIFFKKTVPLPFPAYDTRAHLAVWEAKQTLSI